MTPISVALATFNGAGFLEQQLRSLAAQSCAPAELVISDDGSTDDTLAIVRAFAAAAPFPVRIMPNAGRLGYRANFMRAAAECSGALIAFCDQDDVWHPDKLARVAARFDDPGVLLVHHNARLVDAQGQAFGLVSDWPGIKDTDTAPMAASPWRFPQGFAMTFRRELLALSPLRERSLDYLTGSDPLAHDQWIYLLALVFGRIRFIAEPLVDYRQHGSNAYGISRNAKSRRARLAEKFEKFSDYNLYAEASAAIAGLLRDAEDLRADWRAPAVTAAAGFDEIARLYRTRGIVYGAASPVARLRAWRALEREGRYSGSARWSLKAGERSRDFVLGVCLARLRHRSGRDPFRDWSLRPSGSFA